jgi:putative hydrolase of the HAD superfamily
VLRFAKYTAPVEPIKDEMKPAAALAQIKAVLLDAVGTVFYADPPVAIAYQRAAERFGARATVEEIERRFSEAFARQEAIDAVKNQGRTGNTRERQRWRGIVAEVFGEIPAQIDPLFETLWSHFAQARHWALFDDVKPTCLALTERGLTLGLASNFDARLEGICRGHVELAACHHVFVSSQLGWRKPCRQFFVAIERALALSPEEILLVGDSLENDYRPAIALGWRALLLKRDLPSTRGRPISPSGQQDSTEPIVIRCLTELIDLLGCNPSGSAPCLS